MRQDLDDGLRFLHTMGMQTKHDLYEAQSKLFALLEQLIAEGKIDAAALEERRQRIREREVGRLITMAVVQIADVEDKYAVESPQDLDCAAIMPICQARCCKLFFSLSLQDLEEGGVKWDYKNPYTIRHGENGACVHQDESSGFCTVYDKRPGICREYDCRKDKRIWKDFDQRILADGPITGRAG